MGLPAVQTAISGKSTACPRASRCTNPFRRRLNTKNTVFTLGRGRTRIIHFGDLRYQHYRDKLGVYAHLDHKDTARRKRYYSRHGEAAGRDSAKYWSHKILW